MGVKEKLESNESILILAITFIGQSVEQRVIKNQAKVQCREDLPGSGNSSATLFKQSHHSLVMQKLGNSSSIMMTVRDFRRQVLMISLTNFS